MSGLPDWVSDRRGSTKPSTMERALLEARIEMLEGRVKDIEDALPGYGKSLVWKSRAVGQTINQPARVLLATGAPEHC